MKQSFSIFILLVLSLLLAMPAAAELREGAWSITPQIGYYFTNGYRDQNDKPLLGLGIEKMLDENWSGEAFYGNSKNINQFRLDGLYHFDPEEQLVPYLAGGVGFNYVDFPFFGSATDLLVNAGGGVKYFLDQDWALRGDARAILADGTVHALATVGISWLYSCPKPAPAPVVAAAPAPKPKAIVPPPVPAPPKDSDGDGVTDDKDKCPGTPKGVIVDADGCPVTLTLHINFDFNKYNIKPEYTAELDKAAVFINKYPTIKTIRIEGHTDSIGSVAYNQRLSERRAKAVYDALVNFYGIESDRLVTLGFGKSRPIADNSTDAGRFQNRRVEILYAPQSK